MADRAWISLLGILELVTFISDVKAYDVCYPSTYSFGNTFTCYGDNEYCCHDDTDCCKFMSAGAIAGVVIGCLFALGIVITCICMCVQHNKRRPGVVVQPNQQGTVAYVSYSGQTQYSQPNSQPYGQQYGQQYGQLYGQQQYSAPPPPYNAVQFTHPPQRPSPGQE